MLLDHRALRNNLEQRVPATERIEGQQAGCGPFPGWVCLTVGLEMRAA